MISIVLPKAKPLLPCVYKPLASNIVYADLYSIWGGKKTPPTFSPEEKYLDV